MAHTCSAHLRVHDFPNPPRDQHACDPRIPDYFNAQQDYVYKELEQQYYPAFLREKGFGNLTRPGVYGSLIAGLFCLWAGFVVAFTLVFYDYKPKVRRLGVSSAWCETGFSFAFRMAYSSSLLVASSSSYPSSSPSTSSSLPTGPSHRTSSS
jgi:hypothetical protein